MGFIIFMLGGIDVEINYKDLENEVIDVLGKNPVWVLSTSMSDYVTSRPVSIINVGLNIYFQTNMCYVKYEQMKFNKKVSLSCQNVSIEGIAETIGDWSNEDNLQLLKIYKGKHLGSYQKYGNLNGQVVYKITPVKIKLWKYIDGEPLREVLFVNEQRAERLEFM